MNVGYVALVASALYVAPALAAAAESGTVRLQTAGKFERKTVAYDCAAGGRLEVTYINADPNFLAIVPLAGEQQDLVFASVIAGSGARYAAGKYIWWNRGNSGNLFDTTHGDNAAPVMSCTQAS